MSEQLRREYEIGEEIGRGRFGVVRRCASRATGEPFAVKSVDRSALADDLDGWLPISATRRRIRRPPGLIYSLPC